MQKKSMKREKKMKVKKKSEKNQKKTCKGEIEMVLQMGTRERATGTLKTEQ